ncbi:MAG: response regulator transcription factor [Bacteroidales bacterium]|jgi:DNA-binding response OmpR family regulator|nr:response regulator transcription factor [Bacteroidales bacterium]
MDTKIKILLAEDDVNLGKVLTTYLEAKGYVVKHAGNGEMAYEFFCANDFDVCLVDVMMPVKDGFTLAKEIRKMDKKVPIIFLTAKNFQEDMIEGFAIGGDDYITKPFSMEVLLARLQALLRRTIVEDTVIQDPIIQLGNTTFDVNRQTLTRPGFEVKLTTRESELLTMLINRKNDVLEREYALKKIWGEDSYYNARSMDVYITKLRKYFVGDSGVQIINVHGVGFKIVV